MEQLLRNIERDDSGLLRDPRDWTPELAQELALEDGIDKLSEVHWTFINSLRSYYAEFHVPPPSVRICHSMHLERDCVQDLFPNCLEAWRIAGLPDPGEEAKSYLSAE
ncbi:hypothetical protein MNBD_GAMMA15-719 [hydrothermal vent metagenome]|uniref:Sulfurtransferase n=1 Tax=hydrothermal vent metagenome TaxID=652676 RepID=A0A3B0YQL5_9ZZZZ